MVLVQLYYQILFRKLTHPKSQQKRDSYRSGRAQLSQTFGCPEMVGEKLWYISHNDKITAFLYVTKIQHGFMVSKDVHVFFNKFYSIFFSYYLFTYARWSKLSICSFMSKWALGNWMSISNYVHGRDMPIYRKMKWYLIHVL